MGGGQDRAIDTGDEKLLERADLLEKTLDTFILNQDRVNSSLLEAAKRSGMEIQVSGIESEVSESTVRTADLQADSKVVDQQN